MSTEFPIMVPGTKHFDTLTVAKLIVTTILNLKTMAGGYTVHSQQAIILTMVVIPILSVVKAWVSEIPRVPYVSTETIAHGTMSCDCG